MKFGGMVATRIDEWEIFQFLEKLGYSSGWVPDSQMIWSDCYATLSLAAWHTSRIRLGTGVAIAGTRLAPVTAHSIASINKIAPGRVFLGIGTGHTAMRIMGQDPVSPTYFREYLRVVRGLLAGNEVEYGVEDERRPIRFLDPELGCIDIEHRVPIYVAANGPRALEAAGAYGDGRIGAGNEPVPVLQRNVQRIKRGAALAHRALPKDFHTAVMTFACVLRANEKLNSDRVIEEIGAQVVASLHFWYEVPQNIQAGDRLKIYHWNPFGGAVFAIAPALIFSFINLIKLEKKKLSLILFFIIPFFSSAVMSTSFIWITLLFFWIYLCIKRQTFQIYPFN